MRPTTKQKSICAISSLHLTYWMRTNDISSPTHEGDLAEDIRNIHIGIGEEELTEDEQKELENKMNDLLNFIRKI